MGTACCDMAKAAAANIAHANSLAQAEYAMADAFKAAMMVLDYEEKDEKDAPIEREPLAARNPTSPLVAGGREIEVNEAAARKEREARVAANLAELRAKNRESARVQAPKDVKGGKKGPAGAARSEEGFGRWRDGTDPHAPSESQPRNSRRRCELPGRASRTAGRAADQAAGGRASWNSCRRCTSRRDRRRVMTTLAVWQTLTKRPATAALMTLIVVSAIVAIVCIVTARSYAFKAEWGSEHRIELVPAAPP
jgi:hypothetical protein